MDEADIERIIETYDSDRELRISTTYGDGGLDPLNRRLGRAAMNQLVNGPAAVSRYAIWANTVRDNIVAAQRELGSDVPDSVRRLLYRAANSLSAFSEIQSQLDRLPASNPDSSPPVPYHRPKNEAPLSKEQKTDLLARYFEHYRSVAKRKPDDLNVKVPRKAFKRPFENWLKP